MHGLDRRCKTAWAEGAAPLAVIERASGELAAAITLWLHGRIGELGYWAAPGHRGRGYVPRAVQLVSAWAFDQLELPRCSSGRFPATSHRSASPRSAASRGRACSAPGWSSAASAAT